MSHTPLPWVVRAKTIVCGPREDYLLSTYAPDAPRPVAGVEAEANAALIVAAVNDHPRLLAEHRAMREALEEILATRPAVVADANAKVGDEHAVDWNTRLIARATLAGVTR